MRRLGLSTLVAVTLLASATSAHAQDARIRTDVDTTLVTVGDRVRLMVSVEHEVGARVAWPDSIDLGSFEVLGAEAAAPTPQGDRVVSTAVLTLAAFELGELEIPSFEVDVIGPGDRLETLSTDRFGIEVATVGADEGGDIRDIRGPLGIPVSLVTVSGRLLLLLAFAALAFWAYRRWRRGQGDELVEESGPPPRPAHEVALEALAALETSPLLQRGQVKEFHIEASEILRVYVEARFGVPALEMTTREVTDGLRRAGVDAGFVGRFRSFLDTCDMVKFAKVRPTAERSRETLAEARELVSSSVPITPDPVEPVADGERPEDAASEVVGPDETDVAPEEVGVSD